MNLFASKFPERYIETGVAEQNRVSVAAGMD
jgi:transketolase C-terminal domain/subunit